MLSPRDLRRTKPDHCFLFGFEIVEECALRDSRLSRDFLNRRVALVLHDKAVGSPVNSQVGIGLVLLATG
jgi:hypothetical protein